jgi:hypothetical protein
MAIRIGPFEQSEIPPEFPFIVRTYFVNGLNVAKESVDVPQPSSEYVDEQKVLYSEAKAAWDRLKTWKKRRWSLCAFFTYNDDGGVIGKSGYSGKSLYLKCWLEQRPGSDKQPISPCSARVTDPDASPWNYQP